MVLWRRVLRAPEFYVPNPDTPPPMVLWAHVQRGYLRLISPIADFFAARRINPNTLTTLGTLCSMVAGGIYASGQIRLAGWVLGLTAVFDALDGEVARRSGRTTVFGAFYDSTLDRVADGAVLGGLCLFFARNGVHQSFPVWVSTPMVAVLLLGIIGSFLTSYTRARAEGLGIDAKVGILQRPERVVLLSAPQAFFGLLLNGWVLVGICMLLVLTAWITVVQRIKFVHRATFQQTTRAASATAEARLADMPERHAAMDGRGAGDGSPRRPNDVPSPPQLDVAR